MTAAAPQNPKNMIYVEFKQLVDDPKTDIRSPAERNVGIGELAALIQAKGLLQPIVVRPIGQSRFDITAGRRRYRAIGALIKDGSWPKTLGIPVVVRKDDDEQAHETALIENIGRLPMHAVDRFEAFAKLEADGMSQADIATRHGITEKAVRQALALGNLHPDIRKAWRAGDVKADTAQVFAICPDQKLQAKTFHRLKKDHRLYARDIRQALVSDRPRIDDPRVKFVGLERYKDAGGGVVESLFANDGYLTDGTKLQRLVLERAEEECQRLVEVDGWAWAEINPPNHQSMQRLYVERKYTRDEQARLKAIEKERQALEDAEEWDDEADDALMAETQAIHDAASARAWPADMKAKSGCAIVITDHVKIERGLIRPKKSNGRADENRLGKGLATITEPEEPDAGGLSYALIESVTETLTIAAARALATDPELALRVAVVALMTPGDTDSPPARLTSHGHRVLEDEKAEADAVDDDNDEGNLFAHRLTSQRSNTPANLMRVFAGLVAGSLNLVRHRGGEPVENVVALIAQLPGEEFLKAARELFQPQDFFDRAPGRVAIAAMEEMGLRPDKNAKKKDLALAAAANGKDLGWLPAELRHPAYKLVNPERLKTFPPATAKVKKKGGK